MSHYYKPGVSEYPPRIVCHVCGLEGPADYPLYMSPHGFTGHKSPPFFPFLNMVTLFLIIGIGADDVFVYVDTWKSSFALLLPRREHASGAAQGSKHPRGAHRGRSGRLGDFGVHDAVGLRMDARVEEDESHAYGMDALFDAESAEPLREWRLPAALAGGAAAGSGLPDHPGQRPAPRRQPGNHGLVGGDAAAGPVASPLAGLRAIWLFAG